jgi:hypothetical protein
MKKFNLRLTEKQKPTIYFLSGIVFVLYLSLFIYSENINTLFTNTIGLAGDGSFTAYFLQILKERSIFDIFSQNITSNTYGWPFTSNFGNYPIGSLIEVVVIKVIFIFSNSLTPANIIHILSILKSLVIFSSSFWCLRQLKVTLIFSLIGGIIFSLSSYNLIRSEGHFWLGMTWAIPLGVYCLILVTSNLLSATPVTPIKTKVVIFILGLSVGLTSFYYGFFFLFLSFAIFILSLLRIALSLRIGLSDNIIEKIKPKISTLYPLLLFVSSVAIGLAIQLIPSLIKLKTAQTLIQSSERTSFTEPFIYGGTFDSLFYDLNKIIVRVFLNRPDIQNYLGTRNSWEGSQLGALTGLILYLLIFVFILYISGFKLYKQHLITLNSKIRATLLLLFLSLLFYFPTFLSLSAFILIPNVRAIGRFSVIISFLSICLLLLTLSNLRLSKSLTFFMALIIFLTGIVDAYSYKMARQTSEQNSIFASDVRNQRQITLSNLESKFPKGCAITVVPIQPFPEFDRPDDNNIDYASFDLILAGNSHFKWGIGTFKNTYENKLYENLYSQLPNFARTDLPFLLNYLKASGMCGVVLDRTLMTQNETYSFESFLKPKSQIPPVCISDLGGEKYENISRFFSFDLSNNKCKFPGYTDALKLFKLNDTNNLIWKNNTAYGIKYENGFQFFKSSNEISLVFVPTIDLLQVNFVILLDSKNDTDNISVCYSIKKSIESCKKIQRSTDNDLILNLNKSFTKGKIHKIRFRLDSEVGETINWAVFPKS